MSDDIFIKLLRSAEELFDNDIDAFIVLTKIAFQARRKTSKYDRYNLKQNQAFIESYKSLGLSQQRWRDTKERIELKYKLATFKGTNKGTIATLLSTEIYDINSKDRNEQENEPGTNKERTRNEQALGNENGDIQYRKECKNVRSKKYQKAKSTSDNLCDVPTENPQVATLLAEFFSSLSFHLPSLIGKLPSKSDYAAMEWLLSHHGEVKIRQAITFAHTSEFWRAHVHTPQYLKKKFDTLIIQQQTQGKSNAADQTNFDKLPAGSNFRSRAVIECGDG